MLHLNEAAMAHSCNTKKEGMRQIEKRSASPTMGEILNGEEHLTGCCKSFLRKQLIQILTMSLEKEALFGGKFLACRLVKHQRSKLGELQNIHPQVGARATVLEILVTSRFCGMSRAKDQVHDLTVACLHRVYLLHDFIGSIFLPRTWNTLTDAVVQPIELCQQQIEGPPGIQLITTKFILSGTRPQTKTNGAAVAASSLCEMASNSGSLADESWVIFNESWVTNDRLKLFLLHKFGVLIKNLLPVSYSAAILWLHKRETTYIFQSTKQSRKEWWNWILFHAQALLECCRFLIIWSNIDRNLRACGHGVGLLHSHWINYWSPAHLPREWREGFSTTFERTNHELFHIWFPLRMMIRIFMDAYPHDHSSCFIL